MGQFKLLEPLGAVRYYLAEERDTRRKVTLLILPNATWPGGIEYRVIE